ncbi:MAG: hypothetical protein IJV39_01905 [Ruminococcus sp.]|nr:hypothetical protein [Ruminococcus sp.]
MIVLSYSDVLNLKKAAAEKFTDYIHFHDACGGQNFSLDKPNAKLEDFIRGYFSKQNIAVDFTDDGLNFTLKEVK